MKSVLALAALIATQSPAAPQSPVFQTKVELVGLDVSVSRNGKPLGGLTARDFIVLDNGEPQEPESAVLETDAALDVQTVLDTSGSVSGDRLAHLISAGTGLVEALRAGDHAGLITFSDIVHVRAKMTDDFGAIALALSSLTGERATALRDAVELGLSMKSGERAARPLLIVFSDGVDNASWLSDEEVIDTARRAGIVTHVVNVPGEYGVPATFLDQLTRATGGREWQATSNQDLERLFTTALDEMRSRYLLTFVPRGRQESGWHQLSVKLRTGRADITARPGYVAP